MAVRFYRELIDGVHQSIALSSFAQIRDTRKGPFNQARPTPSWLCNCRGLVRCSTVGRDPVYT